MTTTFHAKPFSAEPTPPSRTRSVVTAVAREPRARSYHAGERTAGIEVRPGDPIIPEPEDMEQAVTLHRAAVESVKAWEDRLHSISRQDPARVEVVNSWRLATNRARFYRDWIRGENGRLSEGIDFNREALLQSLIAVIDRAEEDGFQLLPEERDTLDRASTLLNWYEQRQASSAHPANQTGQQVR